jgi:hypothetical protein
MMQHIHDVLTRYGFLSSSDYPPNFSVPHYLYPNDTVCVDYWHPNKDYVIHILPYQNEGKLEECCYIIRRNGDIIKEVYDDFDNFFSNLFSNDVAPINPPNQNIYSVPASQNNAHQVPTQSFFHQPSHLPLPLSPQYPLPLFNINDFLNAPQLTNYLNLESVIPQSHVIHKMASYLNREFPLPMSTLILVGLGVASGMTARKWNCAYHTRGTSPICLYVVAEQKSGKGKTAALDTFQEPLRNIVNELIKKIKCEIEIQTDNLTCHLDKEADDLSKEYKARFKLTTKQLKEQIEACNGLMKTDTPIGCKMPT